ncbi:MAG: DUF4339 domain-containing protein [Verrucomicrobia bacterium]|nr:DUF4339 domain-containing protein [Verrucomicrobiota bacterium]
MNEGIYYLRLNGKVEGPYTIGQIYDLWAARKINSQTAFARFEEMDKWQPLSELTLKISAPKPLVPKIPAQLPEPAAPLSAPRAQPRAEMEEYTPSIVYPREQPTAVSQNASPAPRGLPHNMFFSFSTCSGLCIVCGVILLLYCMTISAASSDGREIRMDMLNFKQNGVIIGTGFILMGGLLLIARQITQVLLAIKAGALNKTDRKVQSSLEAR